MKTIANMMLVCGLLLFAGAGASAAVIDPADPDILYTGRWDESTPSQPWCYWIGSSIIASFDGTGITATIAAGDAGTSDYLRVIVDGDALGSAKLAIASTAATYTLASGLPDGVHTIEVVKETDQGRWTVHSLEVDGDGTLVAPPARPLRRIVFFGDSNLAGNSLESEENESDGHLRGSYFGYAGIASRMLDAEYHNVSRSGGSVSSIHDVYDHFDYDSATPVWDFADFPADVVVVNLGANDVGKPQHRIVSDYHAFLDDLRTAHPTAHIMLYNGWGWDYDEPANFIHEVIAERNDADMSSAVFPWVFEQWHGCEYDHAGMARVLVDHLAATLGWAPAESDVMSGYGLGGDVANGGFEEAAPFGGYGWRYLNDAGVSRVHDPGGATEGEYYLRLADGASSHQPNPASDGETFRVLVWMRGAAGGDAVDVTVDFRDQEMWTTPLQTATETFVLTTDWQQYSMTATAPAGAANPVFHTRLTFTAAAGATVDVDDVEMGMVSAVPPAEIPPGALRLDVSPNPFNPLVRIALGMPSAGPARVTVHDLSGRRIAVLADGRRGGNEFEVEWDGRDARGHEVGSGVYVVRAVSGGREISRKVSLVR